MKQKLCKKCLREEVDIIHSKFLCASCFFKNEDMINKKKSYEIQGEIN
jgi:NMD protein affecting ribosome stability and mRNA decay